MLITNEYVKLTELINKAIISESIIKLIIETIISESVKLIELYLLVRRMNPLVNKTIIYYYLLLLQLFIYLFILIRRMTRMNQSRPEWRRHLY